MKKTYLVISAFISFVIFPAFGQVPQMAVIAKLVASSYLTEPDDYFVYHPVRLFDGNPATCWFEKSDHFYEFANVNRYWAKTEGDAGIGETVSVELEVPVLIDEIRVMAGCFLKGYFQKNFRVKTLEIAFNGKTIEARFRDEMAEQALLLGGPETIREIAFTIKEVYPTGQYFDTGISEIAFCKNGEKLAIDASRIASIIAAQPKKWQDVELQPREARGKWGFADPTGSFPIRAEYGKAYPFRKGKALVLKAAPKSKQSMYIPGEFIDKRGVRVTVPVVFGFTQQEWNPDSEYDEENLKINVSSSDGSGKEVFSSVNELPKIDMVSPANHEILMTSPGDLGGGAAVREADYYYFFPDGTCRYLSPCLDDICFRHPYDAGFSGTWKSDRGLVYITWNSKYTMRTAANGKRVCDVLNIYVHETLDWELFYRISVGGRYTSPSIDWLFTVQYRTGKIPLDNLWGR